MALNHSEGQKGSFSEKYGNGLVFKILELLGEIPIGSAKGVLRRVGEEIDHVSVIDEGLLSERQEYDTKMAADSLK